MSDLWRFIPEFIILAAAVAALFVDRAAGEGRIAAHLGAFMALAAAITAAAIGPGGQLFDGMIEIGVTAVFARVAIPALTAVWLLWVAGRGIDGERSREAVAFALFSALGGMFMVSARDLIVLFISLELSTMPAYVMMGYRRGDERGLEGALKYFLLSMLTSLVMLYGMSFLYGIAGSTSYGAFASAGEGLLQQMALVFVLVGFFAKLSATPFHYWTPDAYAGAPASTVAFVSTVPKVAGTVALVSLVAAFAPLDPDIALVLVAAAVLSMLLGNLAAFPQTDLRRLMAYSGVAHTGYILLAVAAGASGGAASVMYAVAYAIPSMAIMLLAAEEGASLDDLGGLGARRPALAWASLVWLLSLVGIPPMVGFFGKLYLFTSAVDAGLLVPVLIAVAMSVVSAGYYFRVLRAIFFGESVRTREVPGSIQGSLAFTLATLAVIALGILASPVLSFLGVGF